jgi:hypothetical protein
LLGALETPHELLRAQVMLVLGELDTLRALPLLVSPAVNPGAPDLVRQAARDAVLAIVGQVPSRYETERYLVDRIRAYYQGALPGPMDYEDLVTVWRWDGEQGGVVPQRYPASVASRLMAARLSEHLYALAPQDPDIHRLLMTTMLDFAKTDAGLDQPLPQGDDSTFALAAAAGGAAVEDVLFHALRGDNNVAAMAAAEVLGEIGDAALLESASGEPRPLVCALQHPDRRVRLAAADAIMRLDPQHAYAGSSYLPEALGYFVRSVGSRRALVAHPRVAQSQTLIGMINQIGYEADAARTGNEAFRLASRNPDYEFVLISDALGQPAATETMQMFRRDPATAGLPLGLMAREQNLQAAADATVPDPLAISLPRPHDPSTMAFQAARLLELAGRSRVGYDERLDQASRALQHLAKLAANPKRYSFYDLYRQQDALRSASFIPPLSARASHVLGLLGSPGAQRALVTLASQHARPLEHRQAAAEAFDRAVRSYGLLLSREEILQQYDRYNRSETLDVGTQRVFGAILDAIEWPSKQQATEPSPAPETGMSD